MATTTFDALAYFERLKSAGVPEAQAKAQASAFQDFAKGQQEQNRQELATKADIELLRSELRGELRETEFRLEVQMQKMENRIRNWLIGTMLGLAAVTISGLGVVIASLPR